MTRLALSLSLRDLLHIRGYKLGFAERVDETVYVTLSTKRKTGRCPVCGKRGKTIESQLGRWVRDRDIYDHKCYILFPEKKIKCRCGYRGIEDLEFADPYSRCTLRLEEYVFRLCKYMTLQDVSELMELSWRTVKNIDKKHLSRINIPALKGGVFYPRRTVLFVFVWGLVLAGVRLFARFLGCILCIV
jgi:transposase